MKYGIKEDTLVRPWIHPPDKWLHDLEKGFSMNPGSPALLAGAVFGLLILAAAIYYVISHLLEKRRIPMGVTPYLSRERLLSPAENLFYEALLCAANGHYWIFPKVRLADIVEVHAGLDRAATMTAFNRIHGKHVGFVLCLPGDYRIVALIELDDKSHTRRDRQERDLFVDKVALGAGIPILRVHMEGAYDHESLARQISGLTFAKQPA